MEDKIRKTLKIVLWTVFGGAAVLGAIQIVVDAFKDSERFNEEATVLGIVSGRMLLWLLTGVTVVVVCYLIQAAIYKIKAKKDR